MEEHLPTSIRLRGQLAIRVAKRAGKGAASAVIRRDIERYYQLLLLAEDRGGNGLTLRQALILVGEGKGGR